MPGFVTQVSGAPVGNNYGVAGTQTLIDPQFQGQIIGPIKPQPYMFGPGQLLGHYRVAVETGLTTGLAAGALLFSLRWGDASRFLLLKRIRASAAITTAFTAAQVIDLDAIVARGWVNSDSAGTAVAILGNSNKVRTSMGSSLLGIAASSDIRVAAAVTLTAGSPGKTLDANAFAAEVIPGASGGVIGAAGGADLYKYDVTNQHPMMFAPNEGFNIRNVTAQGAVGVVKYYFVIEYAEVVTI